MRLTALATNKSFVRFALFFGLLIAASALLAGCGQQVQAPAATPKPLPSAATVATGAGEKSAVVEQQHPTPSAADVHASASVPEATLTPAPGSSEADANTAQGPSPIPTADPAAVIHAGENQASGQQGWSPLFTELQGCQEKDVVFGVSPIDIDYIAAVEPQGELTGFYTGHITPGDHVGFQYDPAGPPRNVYALADGYLKRVERQPSPQGFGITADVKNYHLYFEYSCSLFGSYVHVTELDPAVATADPELQELDSGPHPDDTTSLYPNIPVKAGQLIGQAEAFGLLGMLTVDTAVTLSGFVTPSRYSGEPWKIHSVPPFDYFAEPLRKQLLSKNPRTIEPIGGKIDFDVAGTLAGNWFLDGANYSGNAERGWCGDYYCSYWNTHLAFVYDFVDQNQVRVSIGYDSGLYPQGPYGVKGNSPDPTTVSVDSGLVTLELVDLENRDAEVGITTFGKPLVTRGTDNVVGVMLVQMLDDRSVKMEIIPGANAAQELGFSEAATVYQR